MSRVGESLRGRFRLDAELGRSERGVVYRAFDTSLEREVAIKVLARESDAAARERFLREGALAASLESKHAVRIHEAFVEDDAPCLVTELLTGAPLTTRVGKAKPSEIVRWMRDALDALGEAHAQGILHRDLRPAKLFLCSDGAVKILDFGIAKLADADVPRLTLTGVAIGNVAYRPPMRTDGPRDDIWQVGVTMYELLTGVMPGEHVLASLRARRPDIPGRLARIIVRCLSQDPADRDADGRALARAFASVGERRRAPALSFAGVALFVIAAALASFAVLRPAPTPRAMIAIVPMTWPELASASAAPPSAPAVVNTAEASAKPAVVGPPRARRFILRGTTSFEFDKGSQWLERHRTEVDKCVAGAFSEDRNPTSFGYDHGMLFVQVNDSQCKDAAGYRKCMMALIQKGWPPCTILKSDCSIAGELAK